MENTHTERERERPYHICKRTWTIVTENVRLSELSLDKLFEKDA